MGEDELIPVEEEGEERTRSEKRSEEEEEEIAVEGQSEGDEEEKEEGKWQRKESGSEMIEQLDRETQSVMETPKARDEIEERKTPNSDKVMERYIDQVEYSGEEEEQSEMDEEEMREEGEKDCVLQNEVVQEKDEREDSNGVAKEKEIGESCRSSSEEKGDDADVGRSEGEEKTSLKHTEEDEGNNVESKVTKMSESEDEEIERLESTKDNPDTPLQQKDMLGKQRLSRCDRLRSEVRSVTFDPLTSSPYSL